MQVSQSNLTQVSEKLAKYNMINIVEFEYKCIQYFMKYQQRYEIIFTW